MKFLLVTPTRNEYTNYLENIRSDFTIYTLSSDELVELKIDLQLQESGVLRRELLLRGQDLTNLPIICLGLPILPDLENDKQEIISLLFAYLFKHENCVNTITAWGGAPWTNPHFYNLPSYGIGPLPVIVSNSKGLAGRLDRSGDSTSSSMRTYDYCDANGPYFLHYVVGKFYGSKNEVVSQNIKIALRPLTSRLNMYGIENIFIELYVSSDFSSIYLSKLSPSILQGEPSDWHMSLERLLHSRASSGD